MAFGTIKKFIFIGSTFFVISCASLGSRFDGLKEAPKASALVYVYRPSRFSGSARSPDVFANSAKLGNIKNGGYFNAETTPGTNHIQFGGALGDKSKGISVDLSADQVYFLRVDFSLNNFAKHTRADGAATDQSCGGNPGMPFFEMLTSKEELAKLLAGMDSRVYKDVCVPSMMFVTKAFALEELKDLKQSSP